MPMENLNRIAVVLNPISGSGRGKKVIPHLNILKNAGKIINVFEWTHSNQAKQLMAKVTDWQPDIIVGIGGDGTINLLGSFLIHSNIPLGIIPTGSGNGLARHLQIPMNTDLAIEKILHPKIIKIDAGLINGNYFFCTAGLGYDALIANRFSNLKKRGFIGYTKQSILSINELKNEKFKLTFEHGVHELDAVVLTFANASQYGNNVFIAPLANLCDGILELTVVKKTSLLKIPILVFKLFRKNIHLDSSVTTYSGKQFEIEREKSGFLHYDGETMVCPKKISVTILPSALKVIV